MKKFNKKITVIENPQNHGIIKKIWYTKSVYYSKYKVHRTKGNREMILENEKIKQALEYIKEEDPATTQDTLNMCQIPAPS